MGDEREGLPTIGHDIRPTRVGICWVDEETFWWDATNASNCPVCPDSDDGQHGFFESQAHVEQLTQERDTEREQYHELRQSFKTAVAEAMEQGQRANVAERRITELEAALERAVDFILGAGLTPEGKAKWGEGLSPQEQVDRAISYANGMIAT